MTQIFIEVRMWGNHSTLLFSLTPLEIPLDWSGRVQGFPKLADYTTFSLSFDHKAQTVTPA